jgi:hypothetical protein
MTEVKTRLQEVGRLVNLPDHPFDRLVERRARARQQQRITTLAVGVLVAAGSLGGVGLLMSRLDDGSPDVGAGWEPSRRLALHAGEYFYLRVTSDEAEDEHIRDLETWWAPGGSGEVRNRSTRQDKYPYPPNGLYGEGEFPVEIRDVGELSTNPQELAAQLLHERWGWAGAAGSERMFKITALLTLEAPHATPQLRAALFEVVSAADGVTMIERAHDPAGRLGFALERSERDGTDTATWRMYFDPGTHQALAWTFESSRGGSAWVLLESAIVDSMGERPDLDEWLAPPVEEAPI